MTRIVAVHPSNDLYGSDRMFLASVEAFVAAGHQVTTVLPHEGPLTDELRGCGAEVAIRPFPVLRKISMRPTRAPGFALSMLLALPTLVWLLRRARADVLYVNTIITPIWPAAGRLAGCRVVCHAHENERGLSRLKRQILLAPLKTCHMVIAVSDAAREWITSAIPAVTDRTIVVRNGVARAPAASPVILPGHAQRRLVILGRLSHRKGQDVAIQAVHLLRAIGHDIDLTLVGDVYPGNEDYKVALVMQTVALKVEDHVHFVGYQSNAGAYIEAADAVLVPSRDTEACPLVPVEALLACTPVVASNVSGLNEVIEHEGTGLLVPPDNAHELAEAIAELFADPEFADILARHGRDMAQQRFAMGRYMSEIAAAVAA